MRCRAGRALLLVLTSACASTGEGPAPDGSCICLPDAAPAPDAATDAPPAAADAAPDAPPPPDAMVDAAPFCGDGVISPAAGEECDFETKLGQPILGGATCADLGYPGSSADPGCDPATCQLDPAPCGFCGDGVVGGSEFCDGADLGGASCATLGFDGGALGCDPTCGYDTSECTVCGNGTAEPGEACDAPDLGGASCTSVGFDGGALGCTSMCTYDFSGCTVCGNMLVEPGEECDDGNTVGGDGCDATCHVEIVTCDPDGTYFVVMGGPISYSCCSGLVAVSVSAFTFMSNGATIASSPSNPVAMTGAATTCPTGSFSNSGSIAGGCTETYAVSGSFTGPDTWSGSYSLTFTGPDCDCFGGALGTPCVNQFFPITAMR